ncbi:MAG: phosphate propanoyltransferase [Clostridia bacterium]
MALFIVETSARHIHVTKEDLEILFGKGHTLTNKKDLSQPGQFACEEKVTVVGPRGELKMSILGPVRNATQVEISLSDARTIGVTAPIRESGDVKDSASCKLVGPCGEVQLNEGVIVAKRHIHMTPKDASDFGVTDKQVVAVKIPTNDRSVILENTVIRVSENFSLAMHIDTDEANAAAASGKIYGEIVK